MSPVAPWTYLKLWRARRFRRKQVDLTEYMRVVAPLGVQALKLYEDWRVAVAEPIQDGQKAANASAAFWWRITEALRRYERLVPPSAARRYHGLFLEAMRSGSLGAETAKAGFRAGKTYEVSRGLGFLDDFVKQMDEAEKELSRLVAKYKLLD